jgi:hypothetical protein
MLRRSATAGDLSFGAGNGRLSSGDLRRESGGAILPKFWIHLDDCERADERLVLVNHLLSRLRFMRKGKRGKEITLSRHIDGKGAHRRQSIVREGPRLFAL